MKVTILEVPDSHTDFAELWNALVSHVHENNSDLVLLNEFCFIPWFDSRTVSDDAWREAMRKSEEWESRLSELGALVVIGSRPIINDSKRYNEGFVWTQEGGLKGFHRKNFLPDEEPCWEMSWYSRGDGKFSITSIPTQDGKGASLGFLMCSELWFNEHARSYGKQGASLVVVPRATGAGSLKKWLVGGKAAAVVSGAFVASSNRVGNGFGGQGWLVDPDGATLAKTDKKSPIITIDIDLTKAVEAKSTYPRNLVV